MSEFPFAHLHVHTEYSTLDGFGKPEHYAEVAAQQGAQYLAITDHGNIDGFLKFQKACEKQNVKPIFGCEAYIVPDAMVKEDKERRGHITLLVRNETGFQNLCKLLSYASVDGFYYRPRIDFASLQKYFDGLVMMSGCALTWLTLPGAGDVFHKLREEYPEDVFLEIMPHDIEESKEVNRLICEIGNGFNVPIVATNDCHYAKREDAKVQEVLLAIQTNAKWSDPDRWRFDYQGFYMKSYRDMLMTFARQKVVDHNTYVDACRNTEMVIDRCKDFSLSKREVFLPKIPTYQEWDDNDLFDRLVADGWQRLIRGQKSPREILTYRRRLIEESNSIKQMGFVRYFLIVWEIVLWCNENDVMVGVGRGSCGGSLICYLLGITKVDPIKYGLLFWRFINPDRIDLPDIDLDFQDNKRSLVREHIESLYGKWNVASISTFMDMGGKSCVRDIGRVFDIERQKIDALSEAIGETKLAEVLDSTEVGTAFSQEYPEQAEIIKRMEGQIRSIGQHAAGVCISQDDLRLGKNGVLVKKKDGSISINWDKDDAEQMGLMKLDVLGLSTLTVIKQTLRLIKERWETDVDLLAIDLEDPALLERCSRGETIGCFQIGSFAMRKILTDIGVEKFGHVVVSNALVRPGTLHSGLTDKFIRRKRGLESVDYHSCAEFEAITSETYGIIVYQEQVMRLMREVAGFDWKESEKIRKIIAKKQDPALLSEYRQKFIEGCQTMGTLTTDVADAMFTDLENFAGYAFNLAHSVSYSIIGMWQMWTKEYYPDEFIAASLTHSGEKTKLELVKEAQRLGFSLVLPKIGVSDAMEWKAVNKKLFIPFIEIKGIGEQAAKEIHRFDGNTTKGFFGDNASKRACNSRVKEILSEIGAFDSAIPINALELGKKYLSFAMYKDPEELVREIGAYVQEKSRAPENIRVRDYTAEMLVSCDIEDANAQLAVARRPRRPQGLEACELCELRQCARAPVLPSIGQYNMAIVGEAPGRDEDRIGKGFVGRAGIKLFSRLNQHRLPRELFYVTNVVKCFPNQPSILRSKPELAKYCYHWLHAELTALRPFIVLALGNTPVGFFKGEPKGIVSLNGKCEWNSDYQCWVFYALHPASCMYEPSKSVAFDEAIDKFSQKVITVGGFDVA